MASYSNHHAQNAPNDSGAYSRYETVAKAAGLIAIVAGLLVLSGWVFNIPVLTSFIPEYATMKANTAFCFILVGILLANTKSQKKLSTEIIRPGTYLFHIGSLLVSIIGLLTIAEYLFPWNPGLDQVLLADHFTDPRQFPSGRMSIGTAFGFWVTGLSIFFLPLKKSPHAVLAQALALIVLVEAQIGCLGYIYGVHGLYAVTPYTTMSLPTALLFVLISVGILSARPDEGLTAIITSRQTGGNMARHILPLAVTLPFLIGWLRLKGEHAGYYGTEFGLALFATSNIVLFTILVWIGAKSLNTRSSELHASDNRFRFLADTMPQIIWTARPDGSFDYHNEQWFSYTGLTPAQTDASGWKQVVYPDDISLCEERWAQSIETGSIYEVEYRFKRASDGVYRWHLVRAFPMRNEKGKITQWVGTSTDIDDQKQENRELEERVVERTAKLKESEDRLSAILNSSLDGVIVYQAVRDRQGKIQDYRFDMINPTAEKLMRQDASALLGQSLLCTFPTISSDGLFEKFKKITDENISLDFEYLSTRHETARWYRIAGVKLGDGLVLSYTEITARKLFELDLQEAKVRAESADRAKSEFLAIMSHEIRTPMNGVIGMTGILADTELNEMQRECVQTIHTSGESLLAVINDILDYSKIEAGRLQLEHRSFSLQKCVEEALDLFASQIRMKHLEGLYLIAPDVPLYLTGDSLRLRQILVNLISNAIKFTPKGEVVINVECQKIEGENVHLLFSVADTGIGILQEELQKLFQAFQQVDTSTTRRYGGTGLGLVISRRLSEFMGGKMWVESEFGVGSTFFFSVVLKKSAEIPAPEQVPDPALLQSRSVLIVDDNATNRRILEAQLKIWGMNSSTASGGSEALKKLDGQKFDAALIDFQMPGIDGIDLARKIKSGNDLPLILLSSSGEQIVGEDAELFEFQIPKPIKHSHLFNALLKVTGVKVLESNRAPQKRFDASMASRHPLSILLAEDNTVNQKVGLLMLSRLGYTADLASNGLEAVEAVEKTSYDLILMDIQMPEMNGMEATRIIQKRFNDKSPFIVALTAEALEGDEQKFVDQGFDAYLSKPLQTDKLQVVLKSVHSSDGDILQMLE